MAIDTLKFLVFAVYLEAGFIVIEIPVLPISGVMARIASGSQGTFMHILFIVTRPAVRLDVLEHNG